MSKDKRDIVAALLNNIQASISYFDLLVTYHSKNKAQWEAVHKIDPPAGYPEWFAHEVVSIERALRDALVVRVAAIFENTDWNGNLSISKFFRNGDKDMKRLVRAKKIVNDIIKDRHALTAHIADKIQPGLEADKIIASDLREFLGNLEWMVLQGNKEWVMSEEPKNI